MIINTLYIVVITLLISAPIGISAAIYLTQYAKQGKLVYTLRDAPSLTGTFLMNEILGDKDRVRIEDGAIVTIGATTFILHAAE